MINIHVGNDFSRTPGGRYIKDGPYSGQLFRDRLLAPAIKEAVERRDKVVVYLDGPRGYLSSFLEEAFGGLVRYGMFSANQLTQVLDIRANDKFYEPYRILAIRYIADADPHVAFAS